MAGRAAANSINRDSHEPRDLTLNDLFEELRCAVKEDGDVQSLAMLLDDGRYAAFGRFIATLLRLAQDEAKESAQ